MNLKKLFGKFKPTTYKICSVVFVPWGKNDRNNGGFELHWTCEKLGFGCLTFIKDKNNKYICETECMSRDFVRSVLKYFFETQVEYKNL